MLRMQFALLHFSPRQPRYEADESYSKAEEKLVNLSAEFRFRSENIRN